MNLNNFLPGGPSSTNIDMGGWQDKVGSINGGNIFSASGLMSLFASKPQYIVKAEGGQLEFQSMMEMSTEESTSLPSEPIEQGSFATYNRVIEPVSIKCRLAVQGYPSTIQSMLNRLTELKNSTEKITFITPSASYENLMLEAFDYRKDDHSGHNVLQVDLRLKEVREVPTTMTTSSVNEPEPPPVAASSTANGSCASSVDCGEVQTYTPSSAESSTASSDNRTTARKIGDILRG